MTEAPTTGPPLDLDAVAGLVRAGLSGGPERRPLFPGAVVATDLAGDTATVSEGVTRAYATGTSDGQLLELPDLDRIPVDPATVYDLASLTKLFTTTVVLLLVQEDRLTLDDPVSLHLPELRRAETEAITVRQLLTHTSGLPAVLRLWTSETDPERRPAAVLAAVPERAPGSAFVYSCTGFLTLGLLAERLTGHRIDVLVRERVCEPLGLAGTGHRPLRHNVGPERVAATEARDRDYLTALGPVLADLAPGSVPAGGDALAGLDLRGVVHDENAASLFGAAGNAGVFGPAADLLAFGRAVLDGMSGRRPLLGLDAGLLVEAVTPQLDGVPSPGYEVGLGFRIDDPGFSGGLAGSGRSYGHTGFTGTSLLLDADRDLVVAILTNRVHPSREWAELQPFRRSVHTAIAAAVDGRTPTA